MNRYLEKLAAQTIRQRRALRAYACKPIQRYSGLKGSGITRGRKSFGEILSRILQIKNLRAA